MAKLNDGLQFLVDQLTGAWLLQYDRNDDDRREKERYYGMKLKTMHRPSDMPTED
jgi:hypothetical protein